MNGCVKDLFDLENIIIPDDMLDICVDEQKIQDEVNNLALRYAKEIEVDTVDKGDMVCCEVDRVVYPDGRHILIYTGIEIPGAEKAVDDVLDKKVGDTVITLLCNKNVELRIVKITRKVPATVNNELVVGIGIDGVSTVEEYKNYVRKRDWTNQKTEKNKELVYFILQEMVSKSTYSYKQEDMDEYIKSVMEEYAEQMAEMAEMGMEESEEEIKSGIEFNAKQMLVAKAFCEKKNIEIDKKAAMKEAEQMIEMMELMGETVKDRDSMLESAIEGAYMNEMFGYLDEYIELKLGGEHGNN